MEFKLRFESYEGWALNLQDHTSVTLLDQTRELFDLPNFPMERIEPVRTTYGSWTVQLSEQQARACDHFNTRHTATVSVDPGKLNQFAYLKKDRYITQEPDGSYKSIRAEWSIDEKKLINHWFLSDCPLNWKEEEEEQH